MAAPMKMHGLANFFKNISKCGLPTNPLLSTVRHLRGRAIKVLSANEQNNRKPNSWTKSKLNAEDAADHSKSNSQSSRKPAKGFEKHVDVGLPYISNTVNSTNMCVPYTELEESDRRFGPVLALTKSRKNREKQGKILLEGKRLITDAIMAGAEMEALYFSRHTSLDDMPLKDTTAKIFKLRYKSIKNWSDTQTPAGLMGIFKMPKQGEITFTRSSVIPVTLICDNIREPGNMGTLLRSAACAGCTKVLVSKGCVDVWEPKVLRSGAGAHFRIPIISNIEWAMMPNYVNENSAVFLADNSPMDNETDQAIVSSAIRTISELEKESEDALFENEAKTDVDTDGSDSDGEEAGFSQVEQDKRLEAYRQVPMKSLPYFDVNLSKEEAVLVVGGETEGLSTSAHALAYNKFGHKVHIPMCGGTDSLNSAVASGIILFEMQRQYLTSASRPNNISENMHSN